MPIVKATFPGRPDTNFVPMKVDVCVNNLLALHNTDLLRTYASLDVRVRQLGLVVKAWAKARGIAAASGKQASPCQMPLCAFPTHSWVSCSVKRR